MSSQRCPLHVIAISHDVSLLHEISWMLEAVGYKVQTTSDHSAEALWRRYAIADLVLVDGREIKEPSNQTFAHDSDNPTYRIFLYDPNKSTDFAAWYAAGVHDALRIPLSRGELLARARTGARYLEFERRMRRRSSRCAVPGLYSRRGFLQKLRKLAAGDDFGSTPCTLLVTSIDWFAGIRGKCGETVSRSLENAAARAIRRAVGESAVSAYFGDGRFATLLVGQAPAAAKHLAESLSKDFASRESRHESIPRPALTSAVMPWDPATKADRCLSDALELLDLAGHSGSDCVVMHGDFNKQLTEWRQEMATGNPFSNVVAQDIMEPFPALLEYDAPHTEVSEALRRAGLPVRPFVDKTGKLKGVASEECSVRETRVSDESGQPSEKLVTPETISFDASFPEIYEAFSSRGCATLVVTHDEHPLGYLTCDGFLSLIDPLHAQSFAHTDKSADELAYLVVPSTISEAPALQAAEV
ncbi:MAG TPA: GGDEF domain-containing protein [Lacipirellulaceae bacterium]|nr:GGDEF domain-containing protein [Lacipirellulaceae bacterium]